MSMWKIFLLLLISSIVGGGLLLTRYCFWRRKISSLIKGKKVTFFSLLGNMSDLTREANINGRLLFVYAQQLSIAYAKLFPKENFFCTWLFFRPFIVIAKAAAVEEVLSSNNFVEKSKYYNCIQPLIGAGIILSRHNIWKPRRKILNSCFRYEYLKEHLPIINEKCQFLVKSLKEEICKDFTHITKPISLCALDIICDSVLGIHIGAQESKQEPEFIRAGKMGFRLAVERFRNILVWSDFIFYRTKKGKEMKRHIQTLKEFMQNIVQKEKRKYIKNDLKFCDSNRRSLVRLLLEHHFQTKEWSDEDIMDELFTFIIAGHDTTVASISWTLYMLGLYPDIQKKVHEELDWIFGEDIESPVTENELRNMKYLKCVIKETLRLYPSVSIILRSVPENAALCGHPIPKEAMCVLIPSLIHRDEDVFPNPEKFDPDRFLPENSLNRHPYAYIPFSAGPKNCIGQTLSMMEQLVIISTILRNYTVESLDHRDQILPGMTITITSSKPIRIKFRSK